MSNTQVNDNKMTPSMTENCYNFVLEIQSVKIIICMKRKYFRQNQRTEPFGAVYQTVQNSAGWRRKKKLGNRMSLNEKKKLFQYFSNTPFFRSKGKKDEIKNRKKTDDSVDQAEKKNCDVAGYFSQVLEVCTLLKNIDRKETNKCGVARFQVLVVLVLYR